MYNFTLLLCTPFVMKHIWYTDAHRVHPFRQQWSTDTFEGAIGEIWELGSVGAEKVQKTSTIWQTNNQISLNLKEIFSLLPADGWHSNNISQVLHLQHLLSSTWGQVSCYCGGQRSHKTIHLWGAGLTEYLWIHYSVTKEYLWGNSFRTGCHALSNSSGSSHTRRASNTT